MRRQTLERVYSSKTDEELQVLAADADSLIEEARHALRDEFRRRNLPEPSPPGVSEAPLTTKASWKIRRPLHLASGAAVLLTSTMCGLSLFVAFHSPAFRRLGPQNLVLTLGILSVVTILSFTGACLLLITAIRSD